MRNFNAPSTESLDSIFNRLQKIRNKEDLDTISIDDLYNNFKIVEQEVKRTVTSSSSSGSQNMAFLSSPVSTNEVDTTNIQVSTVSTPVITASTHDNTTNLSDATVSRKTVNVEDTSSKAMVAIDGACFDWSYMDDDDEVPTNMALMAFSDSEASKSVSIDTSNEIKKATDAPIIKDWVSNSDEDESELMVLKSDNVQHKPEQANQPRKGWSFKCEPFLRLGALILGISLSDHLHACDLGSRSLHHYPLCRLAILCHHPHAHDLESLLTISPSTYALQLDRFDNNVSFEEEVMHQRLRKTLTHVLELSSCIYLDDRAWGVLNFDLAGVRINAAKSSACWVWRPKIKETSPISQIIKNMMEDLLHLQDETSEILKDFTTGIENQLNREVKIIRCDNETEFKNYEINQFYEIKGIKREFSNARTLQQNGVAERKNRTLIEAARNMKWSRMAVYIDSLTNSMNYQPVSVGNRTNGNACLGINSDAGQAGKEKVPDQEYILLPLLSTCSYVPLSHEEDESSPKDDTGKKSTVEPTCIEGGKIDDLGNGTFQRTNDEWDFSTPITVNAASSSFSHPAALDDYSKMPNLEYTGIFNDAYDDRDEGAEADYNNLETIEYTKWKNLYMVFIKLLEPDDIIFGSTKRSLSTEFEQLMHNRFKMSSMKELTFFLGLQVDVKSASTPMETHKPLSKDVDGTDVDVHLYRSMISSFMYSTSSRLDIMFSVCAYSRFQVQPKVSHMHAVKRIFRYLKGQPNLGLWYPKDSPLELIAYSDSDDAGASLDRKSITGGCQFLGSRLIFWQCKKQTIVANSTTEVEYIAASNCRGQVLWLQNQLLEYGYNFMQTKIHVDNESAICVVKILVCHSKTKHIEIRHHFIRDSYEKMLIEMVKIHTDYNIADILTKAFDVTRF
uniref:Integrase catalytic domain-containing protein n=1 Tax=Tanacetum cinerariifolium TaxID=118510 RepID=A0A6L2LE72_TANCI|nr:hypothetical protein [Tanacetum cinerariifolium]